MPEGNEIYPEGMPYLNENTDENITTQTDDRFFMEPGEDIHKRLAEIDTVLPFKKNTWVILSLKSSNVTAQQQLLSSLTCSRT